MPLPAADLLSSPGDGDRRRPVACGSYKPRTAVAIARSRKAAVTSQKE